MASKKSNRSSAVTKRGATIMSTTVLLLSSYGNKQPLSPSEVADFGIRTKLLQVPRGRTRQYLNQLVQSSMYNSVLSNDPLVRRTGHGKYKATSAGLSLYA